MQKVLFLSLGNRDLQLPQDAIINATFFREHFEGGNIDTGGNFVLKKTDKQFLEHSEAVFKLYAELASQVCFPMLEATLNEVGTDLSQIVLLTTAQQPLDAQDCHYVALFLEKWLLEKGYSVTYRPISFPPVDLEKLMDFYTALYDEYIGYNIFFGNSGGTPDMRAATHMAGMFRGINFVTIQARTQVTNQQNFYNQERKVLQHIIDNMLKVYDYEGIINLPVSGQIKDKCRYALDLYNLKTDIVNEADSFGNKSKKAIALLLENMKVCFQQGRYADVLGRIFRIEEAIGQFLLHKELFEKGGLTENDKVIRIDSKGKQKVDLTFEKTIAGPESSESMYLQYFSEIFIFNEEKKQWYFIYHPTVPMKAGKNTFFFLFQSIGKYTSLYHFFERLNDGYSQSNRLTQLRNRSYLGHGFKGVSKMDIEDITGDFMAFYNGLKNLLEQALSERIYPIFDQVNAEISTM